MDYKLIRSDRRTLALEITREGQVLVRAPHQATQDQIDDFLSARQDWLSSRLQRVRDHLAAHPTPDAAQTQALRAKALEVLPERVRYYGSRMGLQPVSLTITGAKTRFGSCSSRGRISFSWLLMQYPREAIDYVVVHELAHLVHQNHSPAFYRLVASVLPDYRQREALLRY